MRPSPNTIWRQSNEGSWYNVLSTTLPIKRCFYDSSRGNKHFLQLWLADYNQTLMKFKIIQNYTQFTAFHSWSLTDIFYSYMLKDMHCYQKCFFCCCVVAIHMAIFLLMDHSKFTLDNIKPLGRDHVTAYLTVRYILDKVDLKMQSVYFNVLKNC